MYKPTEGDLRYIAYVAIRWRMTANTIAENLDSVPEGIIANIKDLENGYKDGLEEYYIKAMDKDPGLLADEIIADFDKIWTADHPEFHDMEKLFAGCSKADLEKVKKLADEMNA